MSTRDETERERIRRLVAQFVGAAIHGTIFVGRVPDGYDGATKDDVLELACEVAALLDDGWALVPDATRDALVSLVEACELWAGEDMADGQTLLPRRVAAALGPARAALGEAES